MTEQELKDKEYRLVHDEYSYGDVEELIDEVWRLRKALERVLESEVVKTASFAGYSEALSYASYVLKGLVEKEDK